MAPHSFGRYMAFNLAAVSIAAIVSLLTRADFTIVATVAVGVATWLCGYTSRRLG